jgi:hypothetical protein
MGLVDKFIAEEKTVMALEDFSEIDFEEMENEFFISVEKFTIENSITIDAKILLFTLITFSELLKGPQKLIPVLLFNLFKENFINQEEHEETILELIKERLSYFLS